MLANYSTSRQFGLPHAMAVTRNLSPMAPKGLKHFEIAKAMAHTAIHGDDIGFMTALGTALKNWPELKAGTVRPDVWEKLRKAAETFGRWLDLRVGPFERKGTVVEVNGVVRPWMAAYPILGSRMIDDQVVEDVLGWIAHADSSEPKTVAEDVKTVFADLVNLLGEATPHLHAQTTICGQTVLLDKNNVGLAEDAKRKWTLREIVIPGALSDWPPRASWEEIIDAKTGQRLEDIIAGTDGEFRKAHRARSSTLADHDLRRQNINIEDRTRTFPVTTSPEAWARLVEAANSNHKTVGEMLAKLVTK